MASKRIDISVNGKDNTSSAFSSASKNISKLGTEAGKAGTTIGTSIGKGATTASTSLGKLGTTASSTFQKIASGASSAGKSISNSFSGLDGAISGLLGGYSAMNVAQAAWSGAVSQDFNKQFLATKVGTAAASEYVSTIQNIVAAVPGPDSWMNNLLSGAVAKQTNLSSAELKTLADMSASYYLTATGMGKSSIETQNDLNEYIKTGNTSQLERDSILKDQLDKLEGQATVSDRIKALQAAMVADGYDQVSNLDTLGNKWETVSGLIGKAATSLGNAVAPAIMTILDGLMSLDTATNGWSTQIGLVGVALVGVVSALGAAAPLVKMLLTPWKGIYSGIVKATTALWKYVVAAEAADKADDGVGQSKGGGTKLTTGNVVKTGGIITGLAAVGLAVTNMWDAAEQGAIKAFSTANYLEKDENGVYHEQFWKSPIPAINDFNNSIGLGTANAGTIANNAWNTVRSSFMDSASQIRGAWGNTVSWFSSGIGQISSGANNAWNTIQSGAQNAFNTITGAWNSLKGLVGAGATGVVSIFGPTIASIRSAVSSLWGLVRQGAQGVVRIFSSGIDSVRSAVSSLYSMVRAGAQGVVSIVRSVVGGPGGPRGPAGALSGISFRYENYGGWQKNAWTGENSMSGNCADMTAGLISKYGGSYVSGTWNGNPHVWWRSPDGSEFDPARYALNGTGSPPPRGPSAAASGTNYIIQGDIYGWDDFVSKVAQASGSMTKDIRRMR